MGLCPMCKDENEHLSRTSLAHLVVTKNAPDNHIHIHGDLEKVDAMKELITNVCEELHIPPPAGGLSIKEVVFHNKQRIGDMLMFTCAVRDFKLAYPDVRVNVINTAPHIFDFNPYIDRTLVPTEENTLKIGPGRLTNASNRLDWHFANAYRVSIEDALHIHIPQGESRPDIWLTKEEYDAPRQWPFPYWLICVNGEKGWGCKMYPFQRWQKFVDQNPELMFVQVGTKEDNPPRLQGKNVIDWVGQTQSRETGIRDLFKLFLNAEGSVGLVSFHMHLSAAFKKPCLVVAGAREPVAFTRYAGHQYLATDGCLPCAVSACWHCDINACPELVAIPGQEYTPRCVEMIDPGDLTRALKQYYIGGRLKYGVPSQKPKFKNVVPTPAPVVVAEKSPEAKPLDAAAKFNMSFGGGALTEKDWEFIKETITRYKAQTILEFGAGLSTLLLNDLPGLRVLTYETNERWIDKIKAINPACDIRLWDGLDMAFTGRYDLIFVDGPAGDKAREISTKIASEYGNTIIIHDAGREWARKYQEKYFVGVFHGPAKGGHRCLMWTKERGPACHLKIR